MKLIALMVALVLWLGGIARADTAVSAPFVLGPPPVESGPVVVQVAFTLQDINQISDESETFEFNGIIMLRWNDPRQAFDPAVEGVHEKVYQGDGAAPGWFPQVVLVNEAGSYQKSGSVLRVLPDGTSTLIETIDATASANFNMRRYPLDHHRLRAVFEVLGFDRRQIALQPAPSTDPKHVSLRLPQWTITDVSTSAEDRPAAHAGDGGVASSFVLTLSVKREPFYVIRLVVIPLMVIVLLSFAVFWMDRSSLGDRINVSFIGILTGVAYQIVMSQNLPRISYITLMHAFLSLSFLTMCSTVVVNLVVGSLDKQKKFEAGDRIDRRCRWAFPLTYFGVLGVLSTLVIVLFNGAD